MGSPRHRRAERDGIDAAPYSGEGWDRPDTVKRRGIVSPRYRKSEKDGLAPTPHSGEGVGSSRYRKAERNGIAPAAQSGEGWDRPGNAELR